MTSEVSTAVGITLANLHFSYGGAGAETPVFRGLNCRFDSHRISIVLGRSGCGKSTLLKLLCGLLVPNDATESGADAQILVAGLTPAKARRRRLLGYLPQDGQPAPWRTARENLRLALEMANSRGTGYEPLAAATLARLGLQQCEERYPHQLSGGQRRRVAIAMSIVAGPSYLLLDEPFRGLDAVTRAATYRFLLEIWAAPTGGVWSPADAAAGRGMLLVTHDLDEAVLLGDRIYVMRDHPVTALSVMDNPLRARRRTDTLDDLRFDPGFRGVVEELRGSL